MLNQSGRTRRQILKAVLGGAAGAALAAPVRRLSAAVQSPAAAGTRQLADDLFVIRVPGEANVVAFTGTEGVILVDGASASGSDALLRAVAALPGGGPVHTLFNTHWHPEQTGSNERLGRAGTAIVAHENTRLWLTTDIIWPWNGRRFTRLPPAAQPNRTFYTTGMLKREASGAAEGSREIRYGYIPDAAHTDGDLYVYFPEQNVLAVGDVVSGEGWPVVDWATGGWIGGIVGGLERVLSLADEATRIVPARGEVLGVGEVRLQLDMFSTIYDRLAQLLNKGRGPAEAVAAHPTKEFDARMGNPDEFVHRAFESLWAYLSPDA